MFRCVLGCRPNRGGEGEGGKSVCREKEGRSPGLREGRHRRRGPEVVSLEFNFTGEESLRVDGVIKGISVESLRGLRKSRDVPPTRVDGNTRVKQRRERRVLCLPFFE